MARPVRFDASAKKLIAEKSILAYILKSAFSEYEPYTVQKIAEKFIEGEPEIVTLAVYQDHLDRKRIEGQPSEDTSQRIPGQTPSVSMHLPKSV